MNTIQYIVDKINKNKPKHYHILTHAAHEGYQSLFNGMPHTFYLLNRKGMKTWEKRYRHIPNNHIEIDNPFEVPNVDFVLSHERFGSLQHFLQLQLNTRWPIIHLEHVQPQDRWPKQQLQELKSVCGDINIYITEYNKNSWGIFHNTQVIKHGIDDTLFNGWTKQNNSSPYVLYVVNELAKRDYFCGHKQWIAIKDKVHKACPEIKFKLVGDNGSQGRAAADVKELVAFFQNCLCYLNTSQLSPVPMSLLEAMSCGCPVVTSSQQEIPKIVQDQENGICSNDLDYLANNIIKIYKDQINAELLGQNARNTILKNFNLNEFHWQWNRIFDLAFHLKLGESVSYGYTHQYY